MDGATPYQKTFTHRGAFALGDPRASGFGRTEIVRSHIVNSAAREPRIPGGSLSHPGEYVYRLDDNQRNVTSVQLGSFVLGDDPRIAIDGGHRHFQVSEPIQLDVETAVSIDVIESWYSVSETGNRTLQSITTVTSTNSLMVPPTNVDATQVTIAGEFSLSHNHRFGEWPIPEDLPSPELRGSYVRVQYDTGAIAEAKLYVDDTTATVPNEYSFEMDAAYNVNANVEGGIGFDDTNLHSDSILSFPRYRLDQLANSVNERLSDLFGAGSITTRATATLSSVTGEFAIILQDPERVVNRGTVVRRQLQLRNVQEGDVFWHLGMATGDTVVGERGFRANPNSARTIQLPVTSLSSAQQLLDTMNVHTNPLFLSSTLSEFERTLYMRAADGTPFSITLMGGQYQPEAFAEYVSGLIDAEGYPDIRCTYTDAGNIVFNNGHALDFQVDFDLSSVLADILHYEKRVHTGTITTPEQQGLVGGFVNEQDTLTRLTRRIDWSTPDISAEARLQADSGALVDNLDNGVYLTTMTRPAGTDVLAQVVHVVGTSTLSWAHGLKPGTRVAASNPGTSALSTPHYGIVLPPDAADTPDQIRIAMGGAYARMAGVATGSLPSTGDAAIAAVSLFPFIVDEQTSFLIHGQRPPRATPMASADVSAPASASDFGPAESVLGFGAVVTASSGATWLAPSLFSLSPPRIVLVELVSPDMRSSVHEYSAPRDRPLPYDPSAPGGGRLRGTNQIIATLAITNGFARISEEMTHVDALGPQTVRDVHLRFLNPDMSVVDWRGVNHFLSILLRQSMGKSASEAIC